MTTRVYLPRQEALYQTSGIENLVTSVAAYVQAADGLHTPNKVALMYRAFCEALIQGDLLKLHQIPAIIIQYQGVSYEICVRSVEKNANPRKRKRTALADPMSTSSKEAEKIRAFKLLEMLTKLIKTGNARSTGEADRPLRLEEGQEKSAGELVKLHLEKLSKAEIDFSQAREKVRLAYFHLGQAYARWIFELLPTLDAPVTSKTFHREAYPIVQAHLLKLCKRSNEYSILKRLERARKFFHMGSLIGVETLAECEDLTVKRMDKISMESLSLLGIYCKDELSKMNINRP
ncbi:uncharacterized protein FA14DRAFT_162778 [Meira miltonrushii]|uniref:Uncharacterized protein n=1 Tax=Meira miltonrushii TaxID=1280837 RepID=A0A316V1E0_9BASI|nr:uncharacterized protein FA14DRAFT_162778 [Meira miltonrushii]PWN31369.1 hypothetical protein FA14DRAFT_162778 [Meira miltonrushii]